MYATEEEEMLCLGFMYVCCTFDTLAGKARAKEDKQSVGDTFFFFFSGFQEFLKEIDLEQQRALQAFLLEIFTFFLWDLYINTQWLMSCSKSFLCFGYRFSIVSFFNFGVVDLRREARMSGDFFSFLDKEIEAYYHRVVAISMSNNVT